MLTLRGVSMSGASTFVAIEDVRLSSAFPLTTTVSPVTTSRPPASSIEVGGAASWDGVLVSEAGCCAPAAMDSVSQMLQLHTKTFAPGRFQLDTLAFALIN
jgi:hypothetical protein